MPISELELRRAEATLRGYCADRTDPEIRDELEIVYRIEGHVAFIAERRPDWRDKSVYREDDVAKFVFNMKTRLWTLYLQDSNSRWHRFIDRDPSDDIADLLGIVDVEPIFYG